MRSFDSKTLPTLQVHLKMAQAAQRAVKGGGKSAAAKPGTSDASSSMKGASASAGSGGAPSGSPAGGLFHGRRRPQRFIDATQISIASIACA